MLIQRKLWTNGKIARETFKPNCKLSSLQSLTTFMRKFACNSRPSHIIFVSIFLHKFYSFILYLTFVVYKKNTTQQKKQSSHIWFSLFVLCKVRQKFHPSSVSLVGFPFTWPLNMIWAWCFISLCISLLLLFVCWAKT